MKEYSDSYLNKMWRWAVLKKYDGKCFFCGLSIANGELECHHIVKRKTLLLRYDWRNGISVCKYPHERNGHPTMSCHQFAETYKGMELIAVDKLEFSDYFGERIIPFKQWLVNKGITRAEFKSLMYTELNEIIK